jgi:hypothetical protein
MWVEKFKCLIVTRTKLVGEIVTGAKRVGRIVARTVHGWTKHQGIIKALTGQMAQKSYSGILFFSIYLYIVACHQQHDKNKSIFF